MVKKIIGFGIIFFVLLTYTLNEYRLFSKTYKGINIDSTINKCSVFLIIDIQNDLTQSNGKVHVDQKQVNQIITNINKISGVLNDNNFDIIYVRHERKSPFFKIILKIALSAQNVASFHCAIG